MISSHRESLYDTAQKEHHPGRSTTKKKEQIDGEQMR